MNEAGPDGCRDRLDYFIGKIEANRKNRKLLAALTAAIPGSARRAILSQMILAACAEVD
jgi:hypothetical protein